ncbi:MAG: PAC2 family protein [Candidatus Lokiarchaeota archaeon]|nr:PAC2 family protein [Candidatus Lokiarchaeota archaeon]
MIDDEDGIRIIKHVDYQKSDFINPICILGMPGIADVGKFALDSLIGQLDAVSFMDIIFDDYPAGAIVDDSMLSAPKAEILVWKDPEELRDIVLITADAQSLTPKGIYRISFFITSILKELGISLIVALGAYPVASRSMNSKIPRIFASSTNKEMLESFLIEVSCEKIQKGVIIGANGLIPTLAKARFGIDGLVFLAETDNLAMVNEDITDLRASITLLEMLKKSFTLPIKKNYSLDNIDDITKNLQNKREQLEKDLDSLQIVSADAEEKRKSLYI